jgi:hypothetical protein
MLLQSITVVKENIHPARQLGKSTQKHRTKHRERFE